MDMEQCTPARRPGLQVREKDLVTEEQRRDCTEECQGVTRQRPDAQQAVKALARGMSSPVNIHWARLQRVMRYLVNKQASIWKFKPSASEARDNELTATSHRVIGAVVRKRHETQPKFVLKYAGSTMSPHTRKRKPGLG